MHKKKSEKSEHRKVTFPAGDRTFLIGHEGNNPNTPAGHLNFILIKSQDRDEYHGAIKFENNDEEFGNLSKRPFPLLVDFDPITGGIRFQIVGATQSLNPETDVPLEYHFEFCGVYDESKNEIAGEGGVPSEFYPPPGSARKPNPRPLEDGQTVTWISAGIMDPDTKPSK